MGESFRVINDVRWVGHKGSCLRERVGLPCSFLCERGWIDGLYSLVRQDA